MPRPRPSARIHSDIGAFNLVYAVINSAFVTLRQRGVRWRNTFYPLDTLRKGTVR